MTKTYMMMPGSRLEVAPGGRLVESLGSVQSMPRAMRGPRVFGAAEIEMPEECAREGEVLLSPGVCGPPRGLLDWGKGLLSGLLGGGTPMPTPTPPKPAGAATTVVVSSYKPPASPVVATSAGGMKISTPVLVGGAVAAAAAVYLLTRKKK